MQPQCDGLNLRRPIRFRQAPRAAFAPRLPLSLLVPGLLAPVLAEAVKNYSCETDWPLPLEPRALDRKGLCLDDTTFSNCADGIPQTWPNTKEPIKSLRMFKAWDKTWEGDRVAANDRVIDWAKSNGARILLGVEVSCIKEDNVQGWQWAKEFLQKLGPDHLMGLAIGNELDLLEFKDRGRFHIDGWCINELWGYNQPDQGKDSSYLYRWFTQIVRELDELPGFDNLTAPVPVTSVLSGMALSSYDGFMNGEPVQDKRFNWWYNAEWLGHPMVNNFVYNVTQTFGRRYVHSLNIYPYFSDASNSLDFECADRCRRTVYSDLCFNAFDCNYIGQLMMFRKRVQDVTGRPDDTVWIGEFGWSYPMATTLKSVMTQCTDFNSQQTFASAYQGWMHWDLTVPYGVVRPADHVFYFSVRDSINFGDTEHFGLIGLCGDQQCKLNCAGGTCPKLHCWVEDPSNGRSCEPFELCTPSWKVGLITAAVVLLLTCVCQRCRRRWRASCRVAIAASSADVAFSCSEAGGSREETRGGGAYVRM